MIKEKPPRLELIYINNPLYFLTFCTFNRRAVLANPQIHEAFRRYCMQGQSHNVTVGRYVIMPDHVHLFVRGSFDFDLGIWVRGLKRAMSKADRLWQPGFFDHVLRSGENYSKKWNYVCDNPVRAGLVSSAEEWPFQGEIVPIQTA